MYSLYGHTEVWGFPIQKSPDQSSLGNSPKLFAAFRVFHRLLVPRHPPYALSSLFSPINSPLGKINLLSESRIQNLKLHLKEQKNIMI